MTVDQLRDRLRNIPGETPLFVGEVPDHGQYEDHVVLSEAEGDWGVVVTWVQTDDGE